MVPLNRLIKFEKEEYARIGIMPRYGNADSIRWFEVEPNCTFHILNCFEEGDEVSNENITFFFLFNSLPAMYLMFFFFLLCFFFFFFAGAGCSEGMQVP